MHQMRQIVQTSAKPDKARKVRVRRNPEIQLSILHQGLYSELDLKATHSAVAPRKVHRNLKAQTLDSVLPAKQVAISGCNFVVGIKR